MRPEDWAEPAVPDGVCPSDGLPCTCNKLPVECPYRGQYFEGET